MTKPSLKWPQLFWPSSCHARFSLLARRHSRAESKESNSPVSYMLSSYLSWTSWIQPRNLRVKIVPFPPPLAANHSIRRSTYITSRVIGRHFFLSSRLKSFIKTQRRSEYNKNNKQVENKQKKIKIFVYFLYLIVF